MNRPPFFRNATAGLAGLLLAACGGGTTDPDGPPGPPPTNRPPDVQMVGQVDAAIGQTVTPDAGATTDPEGDPVTYQWTQVLGPPVGTLTGPRPSFRVPTEVGTVAFDADHPIVGAACAEGAALGLDSGDACPPWS